MNLTTRRAERACVSTICSTADRSKVEDLNQGWAEWRLGKVEEVVSEVVVVAEAEVRLHLVKMTYKHCP